MFSRIAAILLGLMVTATADDADAALKRYEILKQNSAKLKSSSTDAEVLATLGEPKERRFAGWAHIDTKLWTYLDYTDDSHHFWFRVTLDPEQGCLISSRKVLRSEVARLPRQVITGTIIDAFPVGFHESGPGRCCSVRCDNGEVIYATAPNTARVTGKPERGGRIRIECFGSPPSYIVRDSITPHLDFTNAGTPHLKSVRFTRADGK